jgi:hypothetical protein
LKTFLLPHGQDLNVGFFRACSIFGASSSLL